MKKIIIAFIALLLLSSCDYYRLKVIERKARNYMKDLSFKENSELKILEFQTIGYDTVDENFFDTVQAGVYSIKYDKYKKLFDIKFRQWQIKNDLANLSAGTGWEAIRETYINDSKEYGSEAKSYNDSMLLYEKLMNARLNSWRFEPKSIYRYRVFWKATITDKDGYSKNYMDSIPFFFDESLNIQPYQL